MPDEISFDRDILSALTGRAADALGLAREGASGDIDGAGIDPAVAEAMGLRDEEARTAADNGEEDGETTMVAVDQARAHADAAGTGIDGIDTNAVTTGGQGMSPGGQAAGAGGGMPVGGDMSQMPVGGASAGAMPNEMGMYPSMMPTMQTAAPMVDYSAYTPTPMTATQYDLNNAPNRAELQEAIYQAIRSGEYNSGEPGDTRPRSGGGSNSAEGETELEQAYLDAMDELVGAEPPIPYAWGGGHGGEPGLSGGISDGGGHADAMGDYNKTGLDCSGFTRYVHYMATGNDDLNGTAAMQYDMTAPVAAEDARPGDLFFPDSAGRPPGHVASYAGGDQMAEAQQSGTDLMFSDLPPGEFRRHPDY